MVLLGTICCIHVGGELLQLMLPDVSCVCVCHHAGEGAGFCGSGGKRESSQIGVTSWYVSTGGIIFYTKKNRFENSCRIFLTR